MLVFDTEVFRFDWLLIAYDLAAERETVIHNDKAALEAFYNAHKNDIWIGYNARGYDQFIIKAILCGFDPKAVNDWIIQEGRSGYQFSSLFNNVPLNFFDIKTTPESLKTLEGFLGMDIRETSVPFNINRQLTPKELEEVIYYCRHDVQATCEVLNRRIEEYTSQLELLSMFKLPRMMMGKTKAQLSAYILGADYRNTYDAEFAYKIPDNLKITKYKGVVDWFIQCRDEAQNDHGFYDTPEGRAQFYSQKLETNVAGVPHIFAWGGLHGAIPNYHGRGVFINVDVRSYYPSLMIECGYLSRSVKNPAKYKDIYNDRLAYKAKKDKRANPLKIVLNSTYGAMKDKYNPMYDPMQANNVCVTGQLYLLDLIEHLEPVADIIQSNTDGILVKLRGNTEDEINRCFGKVDDICYEWEKRTRMSLEFDEFREVWQKDVNNYVIIAEDGAYKSKGAYVKKLSPLDNDLPIVNEALVNYMVKGVPVEQTIGECSELIKFQKLLKVSSKYLYAQHNGQRLDLKTFRVFASKDPRDTTLYKVKDKGGKLVPEKFANCAEHLFIDNEALEGKKAPPKLDKKYYIDLAKKRLGDFKGEQERL